MYSGVIQGVGPRYCPSIEDKIVKFPEKERQQIFLEPEGIATDEIYVNGFSTCLPFEVQLQMVRTIIVARMPRFSAQPMPSSTISPSQLSFIRRSKPSRAEISTSPARSMGPPDMRKPQLKG